MGCVQALAKDIIKDHINSWITCDCPPSVSLDDLSIKPNMRTPLDRLGFPQRCCGCCPLGTASFFICMMSFAWGAYELQSADKAVEQVFPKRDEAFFYTKMAYLLMSLLFVLATGGLLLGILIKRCEPVQLYVWYGIIYDFLMLFFALGSSAVDICNNKVASNSQIYRILLGIIWFTVFFYVLMVVNSYKLKLW